MRREGEWWVGVSFLPATFLYPLLASLSISVSRPSCRKRQVVHGLVGVESLFCQTAWLVLSRRLELSRPRAFGLSDEMEVSCRRSRVAAAIRLLSARGE